MKTKQPDFSYTNFGTGILYTLAVLSLLFFFAIKMGKIPNVIDGKDYFGFVVASSICAWIIVLLREGSKLVVRDH